MPTTTLDVYNAGHIATSGGGLTATSLAGMKGARSSVGWNTGKRYWSARVNPALSRPDDAALVAGFMTSSGVLDGSNSWPGGSYDATQTSFGIGPWSHFIFTNFVYRFSNNQTNFWSMAGGQEITFAIDLDAQLFWFCMHNDGDGTDTGWLYDTLAGPAPPNLDPTLATGCSYAGWVPPGSTLHPFVFFQYSGWSADVNFAPDTTGCGLLSTGDGWYAWNADVGGGGGGGGGTGQRQMSYIF